MINNRIATQITARGVSSQGPRISNKENVQRKDQSFGDVMDNMVKSLEEGWKKMRVKENSINKGLNGSLGELMKLQRASHDYQVCIQMVTKVADATTTTIKRLHQMG